MRSGSSSTGTPWEKQNSTASRSSKTIHKSIAYLLFLCSRALIHTLFPFLFIYIVPSFLTKIVHLLSLFSYSIHIQCTLISSMFTHVITSMFTLLCLICSFRIFPHFVFSFFQHPPLWCNDWRTRLEYGRLWIRCPVRSY